MANSHIYTLFATILDQFICGVDSGGITAIKPAIKPVILARIEPFYNPFTPI